MSTVPTGSEELTVRFTREERLHLLSALEQLLREKAVGVHRTDSLDYKDYLERQEAALRSALEKLRHAGPG
jgi:hypothetical protein